MEKKIVDPVAAAAALQTNRLYVGNLSYRTPWFKIKDLFAEVGPVAHVDTLKDREGNSKGSAIVEFVNIEDAKQAILKFNNYELEGRPIFIRENREDSRTTKDNSQDEGKKVFIHGLPYSSTWYNLKDEFSKIGKVRFSDVFQSNGRSKGQGVVVFENDEDALTAIREYNNKDFGGRTISVRLWSSEKPQQTQQQQQPQQQQF